MWLAVNFLCECVYPNILKGSKRYDSNAKKNEFYYKLLYISEEIYWEDEHLFSIVWYWALQWSSISPSKCSQSIIHHLFVNQSWKAQSVLWIWMSLENCTLPVIVLWTVGCCCFFMDSFICSTVVFHKWRNRSTVPTERHSESHKQERKNTIISKVLSEELQKSPIFTLPPTYSEKKEHLTNIYDNYFIYLFILFFSFGFTNLK